MNITNIVDVIIFLFIMLWAVVGLKRGVIKQGVITIGIIIVFILSFILKNPLAEFLSLNLPFFTLNGMFKGVTAISIIFYQLISFLIVFTLLWIILSVLIKTSSLLEKILRATIILAIPSKILGFILGFIEGVVVTYIILVFLTQPAIRPKEFDGSKLTPAILKHSYGLTTVTSGMVNTFNDLYELGKSYYNVENSSNEFNKQAIDVMLRNKIITVDYVDKLVLKNKIDIVGLNEILIKYR